jgi:energy-converting hydrogenase Eha subunit A
METWAKLRENPVQFSYESGKLFPTKLIAMASSGFSLG